MTAKVFNTSYEQKTIKGCPIYFIAKQREVLNLVFTQGTHTTCHSVQSTELAEDLCTVNYTTVWKECHCINEHAFFATTYLVSHVMQHIRCCTFNHFEAEWAEQMFCILVSYSEVIFHI